MRRIQVFIVTLFVDDEAGPELRGRLRQVRTGDEVHFAGGEELLGLLRQAAAEGGRPAPGAPAPAAT